ncbi:hypothetical protein XENOCAPTIV_018445 [Xenoophorus captivus]|uniref:Uncharacterized protein n=1 Tax=Xenoophorus captivus TaxID=1517983 RepID=A0ABV0SIE6_9TELE
MHLISEIVSVLAFLVVFHIKLVYVFVSGVLFFFFPSAPSFCFAEVMFWSLCWSSFDSFAWLFLIGGGVGGFNTPVTPTPPEKEREQGRRKRREGSIKRIRILYC